MAQDLIVGEARVKIRNPWGVWALTLVTFGIYGLFWYYFVNRELRDFGRTPAGQPDHIEVDPTMSVLAITIGGIVVIPPFVSVWRTGSRIARAQALVGMPRMSMGAWFIMAFVPIANWFWWVFAQAQLNDLWQAAAAGGAQPAIDPPAAEGPVVTHR